jgi:hypothetical protein
MGVAWMVAIAALWLLMLVLAGLVLGLLRRMAPLLEHLEARVPLRTPTPLGLPRGTRVPEFVAERSDGSYVTHATFAGEPWLAIFVSGGCQPCEALVHELVHEREESVNVDVVWVVDSAERERYESLPHPVLIQHRAELSRAFEVPGVPFVVAVDRQSTIAACAVANTAEQVAHLAALALTEGEEFGHTKIREGEVTSLRR